MNRACWCMSHSHHTHADQSYTRWLRRNSTCPIECIRRGIHTHKTHKHLHIWCLNYSDGLSRRLSQGIRWYLWATVCISANERSDKFQSTTVTGTVEAISMESFIAYTRIFRPNIQTTRFLVTLVVYCTIVSICRRYERENSVMYSGRHKSNKRKLTWAIFTAFIGFINLNLFGTWEVWTNNRVAFETSVDACTVITACYFLITMFEKFLGDHTIFCKSQTHQIGIANRWARAISLLHFGQHSPSAFSGFLHRVLSHGFGKHVTTPDLHWHSSHFWSHRSPSSLLSEPLIEHDFLQSQLSKCSILRKEFSSCLRRDKTKRNENLWDFCVCHMEALTAEKKDSIEMKIEKLIISERGDVKKLCEKSNHQFFSPSTKKFYDVIEKSKSDSNRE